MDVVKMNELLEIEGQKLFVKYIKKGENKPTIVFLHDSLGCIQLWRDFPLQLAEALSYNVLIYDRWGYGQSEAMASPNRSKNYLELEADLLYALLVQLNIDDAILFGHSDGASIALIAASKYASKIKAVVSEAAHVFVETITLEGIYKAIASYKTTNLSERLAKYHGSKVETIFKAWTDTWISADFSDWNIEHFLPTITCPVLIIQGEADEYGTLKQVEAIATQTGSQAEKLIIPNCGHSPHKENPNYILERVAIFLQNLPVF